MKKYIFLLMAFVVTAMAHAQIPGTIPYLKGYVLQSQANPPSNPVLHQRYLDQDGNRYRYNGSAWLIDDYFLYDATLNGTTLELDRYDQSVITVDLSSLAGGGSSGTNFGMRKTVVKISDFPVSTEDSRISSGADIYKKPRITVNNGNTYTATLGNIGAVDDYYFFAVDNTDSELIVEPSSVDITFNGSDITDGLKLSDDAEGFLYKIADARYKAKGEWELYTPVAALNNIWIDNVAKEGTTSTATGTWSLTNSTVATSSDSSDGSLALEFTTTADGSMTADSPDYTGYSSGDTFNFYVDVKIPVNLDYTGNYQVLIKDASDDSTIASSGILSSDNQSTYTPLFVTGTLTSSSFYVRFFESTNGDSLDVLDIDNARLYINQNE